MVNTGLPLGGTCVNVGCVPSKRLLAVGERAAAGDQNPFEAIEYGEEPTVDWVTALDATDDLVARFRDETDVDVADHFETDVYAAGDAVGEPELETVAAKEGNHAVKNAFAGEDATIDYDAVPNVLFTSPEVASVGVTEHEYAAEHGTCDCRTVQMADVPRAKRVEQTEGRLQVLKHHETDEIVGVHTVGPRAADTITEATLAVKFGLTVEASSTLSTRFRRSAKRSSGPVRRSAATPPR
jgi:pyruvate/2-oxoglutarate dehydrogenase complex dihydrolipoamide dehydrogenase (E3) component